MERCSGNEKSSTRDEHTNNLREDRIDLFDSMGFVDDGNTDFKILRNKPASDNFRALVVESSQGDNVEIWSPLFEFTVPILECGLGYDDQVRARDIPVVFKIS